MLAWQVPTFDWHSHAVVQVVVTDQHNTQRILLALQNRYYHAERSAWENKASACLLDSHVQSFAANACIRVQDRELACHSLVGQADEQAMGGEKTGRVGFANGPSCSQEGAQTHPVLVFSKLGQLQRVKDLMDWCLCLLSISDFAAPKLLVRSVVDTESYIQETEAQSGAPNR